jgi:hypothetical protein
MERGAQEHAYLSVDEGPSRVYREEPARVRAIPTPMPEEWDSHSPLSAWDEEIADIFRSCAGFLLDDLLEKRLTVVLGDAPDPRFDGHKIRVVENSNSEWYSGLFAENYNLKRWRLYAALEHVANGTDIPATEYRTRANYWVKFPPTRKERESLYHQLAREEKGIQIKTRKGPIISVPKKIKGCKGKYHALARDQIFIMLTGGRVTEIGPEPPVLEVCNYFGEDAEKAESILGDTRDLELLEIPF